VPEASLLTIEEVGSGANGDLVVFNDDLKREFKRMADVQRSIGDVQTRAQRRKGPGPRYLTKNSSPIGSNTRYTARKASSVIAKAGDTCWDFIYNTCARVGRVASVDGRTLRVFHPLTYQQGLNSLPEDGTTPWVAFGEDLESLEVERKFGRLSAPQVIVTSYDPKRKKVVTGKYPPDDEWARLEGKSYTVGQLRPPQAFFQIESGIVADAVLVDIAMARYHALSTQQAIYSFETMDMYDLNGFSLLDVRPGYPMWVTFYGSDGRDPFGIGFEELTYDQRVQKLKLLGHDPSAAEASARAFEWTKNNAATKLLSVREMDVSYSHTAGVALRVTAANYVKIPVDFV
jgi:hypothetical protein